LGDAQELMLSWWFWVVAVLLFATVLMGGWMFTYVVTERRFQQARALGKARATVHPSDLPPPEPPSTPPYKPRKWEPPVPPVDDWERPNECMPMRTVFKPPPPWYTKNDV
jgi:hypothetical protein